jgi:hypothetical protein
MQPLEIPKYTPPDFIKHINFNFLVNTPFLIAIFTLFALTYASVSVVLVYHWAKYGMKSRTVIFTEVLYLLVSLGLFWLASLSLLSY